MARVFLIALVSTFATVVLAQPPGYYGPGRGGAGSYAAPSTGFNVQQGIRFEQGRDDKGYILRIYTRGISPEAIQVSVRGRTLVVENQQSRQVEQRSDRGSYSFSSSSSNMRRRFPLPPDADAQAMQRTVEDGVIVITLPYASRAHY
ncbi:MAG: Hsp20/alpha crystallin family protein [Candidatus Thiodiazotropha sp.]